MNVHPDTGNNEVQQIHAFINQLTVPPSNSSLDMFMINELQWTPTIGLFDSEMLADPSLDTYQTYPIDISSCMPWFPMTLADLSKNESMVDLNQLILSHSSSSPLSYPSMSTPLDPINELILPSMSGISSMWSPTHEQLFLNPLTPFPQLSYPEFIDTSTITMTNLPSQLTSYHPSPQIIPNKLQSANFMNFNLQPAPPTNYRTEPPQSLSHKKKSHICRVRKCIQTFKRAEHLKRHQLCVHFDHRPYQCPIPTCSKFFSRIDNLSAHIKIHQRRSSTVN